MATDHLVIGIDLGGTKFSTAAVDASGRILAYDYQETHVAAGPEAVVERMLAAARRVRVRAEGDGARVAAIGVGSPGPLDLETGVVLAPPNMPGWDRVPLRDQIAAGLSLPVYVDNDANAAALGEHRFGAGRGIQHMIYVTASTGIGGGLILGGKLYHGATGMAGEIGHTVILPGGPLCGCGSRGCLEALASGTSIANRARERIAHGVATRIADLAGGDPGRITAEVVARAAETGDAEAQEILSTAMHYLGIGMANLVNLLNLQLIVIGGGLTRMGDVLFAPVRREIDRHAFPDPARAVRVVPPELEDNAGVLGAAALALMHVEERL